MKKNKLVVSILIILFILVINVNNVLAFDLDKIIHDGDDFLAGGNTVGNTDDMYEGFNKLAGIITFIGIFVAAGIGIVLGIRFTLAASSEQKAEIKKSMMPWVAGTMIVIGALVIWKLSINFIQDIHKDTAGSNPGNPTYPNPSGGYTEETLNNYRLYLQAYDARNNGTYYNFLNSHPDFDDDAFDDWRVQMGLDGVWKISTGQYTIDDFVADTPR